MVLSFCHFLVFAGFRRSQVGHVSVPPTSWPRHCLPPLRRRCSAHRLLSWAPASHHLLSPAGVRDEGPGGAPPLPRGHLQAPSPGPVSSPAATLSTSLSALAWPSVSPARPRWIRRARSPWPPPGRRPTGYRSIVGALQYLIFTRPDIAYAVQQVCLHIGVVMDRDPNGSLQNDRALNNFSSKMNRNRARS